MKMIFSNSKSLRKGWGLAFLLAFFGQFGLFSQTWCDAPTAVCDGLVQVTAGPSGGVTIAASLIAEDSYLTDCPLVTYAARTQGSTGPFEPTVNLLSVGNYWIECRFTAPSGNQNVCWGEVEVLAPSGPCSPDVTPPTAICVEFSTIQSNLNGPDMTIVNAALLDDGSYDDCSAVSFRASVDLTPQPPATTSVPLVGVGDHVVYLWAIDAAGNFNTCASVVTTIAPKCTPDNTAPTLVAPANLSFSETAFLALGPIDYDDQAAMNAAFGSPFDWDNCDNGAATVFESYQLEIGVGGIPKKITRSFAAVDAAGNANFGGASQTISILQGGYTIHLPAWHLPGDTAPVDSVDLEGWSFSLAKSFSDQVFEFTCDTLIDRTLRTWSMVDWVGFDPNSAPFVFPAKDLDGDGQTGDAYDVLMSDGQLFRLENGQTVELLGDQAFYYQYEQEIRTSWFDLDERQVKVIVYLDSIENCVAEGNERILINWPVKITGLVSGKVLTGTTNALGFVKISGLCPADTAVEVSLDLAFDYGQECGTSQVIQIFPNSPHLVVLPVRLETACNLLSVDIATPKIRPCQNSVYHVSYCNLSNDSIENVSIRTDHDDLFWVQGASLPYVNTPPNGNIFQLGTLAPGECGTFTIWGQLDCDAPVGATFCASATIEPFDDCLPQSSSWNGAFLKIDGRCDADSVRFKVKNIGSGGMTTALEYIVVEDLIMRVGSSPVQLDAAESMEVVFPASASTNRLEIPQVAGAPFDLFAFKTLEGCADLEPSGLVNAFSMQTQSPFNSTFCLESVSSFDPNDKKGFPAGYGSERLIRALDGLDYLIRFQNTGTDTAFRVVILDTLSAFLDAKTVRPGASSHAFDFDILSGNVLRFAFENIDLPDSTANFDGSQGFVKFTVAQKTGNPDGTIIDNGAAIFFDQNAPVLTNVERRKIGSAFILTSLDEPKNGLENCRVFPNPTADALFFEFPKSLEPGFFELTDALGRTVLQQKIDGKTARVECAGFAPGLYFFNISDSKSSLFSGKIEVK